MLRGIIVFLLSILLRKIWTSSPSLGMKMDGNGRKTPQPFLYPHFIIGKQDRVRNSRERKQERDKRNCKNERKRKY
jgi:hypothetical protein